MPALSDSPGAPARPTVKVVDGDAAAAAVVAAFLSSRGFRVTRVCDAATAFRACHGAHEHADALVIGLDADLPGALELLTALAGRPHPPAVVATSRHRGGPTLGRLTLAALGVARLLPRPCLLPDVEAAVRAALHDRSLSRRLPRHQEQLGCT